MYRGGYTRDNMFGLKLDYTQFLVELTGALLENVSHRLLLVPHTFSQLHRVESDPAVCAELKDLLPPAFLPRVHLVRGEYDQHEIKALIGKCDFFIGSRMHACIAALSQGIPTIGVAYSKKFKGVFESVGVADCVVDGRDMDVGEAVQKCMALIATRHNIRQILARSVPEARSKILSEFRDLLVKDSGDSPIH
jgi:polysaccharide pyruvyl transferase WcaK-like protein